LKSNLSSADRSFQTCVAAGVVAVGLAMAAGAFTIPSAAGYAGVGPNFLPWVVSIALVVCGGLMLYEAQSGGFRDMEAQDVDAPRPYWGGFVWMSAGLLLNAALITTIGFIFSCALCFVLAARGLRLAGGEEVSGSRAWVADTVTGLLIAAPVFWMFTKFLAINLPGITSTGWL
jgi:putative tricarboxylic transport membrane protein